MKFLSISIVVRRALNLSLIRLMGKYIPLISWSMKFTTIRYLEKTKKIERVYTSITMDPTFIKLSSQFKGLFACTHADWQPVSPDQIRIVVSHLPDLRNFVLSMTRGVIHMQFNCDGTHIIGTSDYLHFIEQNVEEN